MRKYPLTLIVFFSLILLLPATRAFAVAEALFAVDRISNLYSVDPASGTLELIGPMGVDRVSAMAFDSDSQTLYAAIGGDSDNSNGCLYTVDMLTGVATKVGCDNSSAKNGMSFMSDGTLFATRNSCRLITIDPTDANELQITANIGDCSNGNGIAFNGSGDLYHANINNLNILDTTLPYDPPTLVAALSFTGFPISLVSAPAITSLAYNSGGVLYGTATVRNNGRGPTFLSTINPTTAEVTNIAQTAVTLDGLVWADLTDDDGDGMGDIWESANGLNTIVDDSVVDPDGDGLTNLGEFQHWANPHNGDTDGDNLSDWDEANIHITSLNNADSDSDGLLDGEEANAGNDPLDWTDGLLKQISNDQDESDQPDVAKDSNGNFHIVWRDDRTESTELFYKMLDSSGNTLIDETMITDNDDFRTVRPSIALNSNDNVIVVWHDKRNGTEVWGMMLDPYLDDLNGDEADPAAIKVETDFMISQEDSIKSINANVVIGENDVAHVVWEEGEADNYIKYLRIDTDTTLFGPIGVEVNIAMNSTAWRSLPQVALDSFDKLHVSWGAYSNSFEALETYYALVDTTNGDVLIAATLMTEDDGVNSFRSSLTVDEDGNAHIIWQEVSWHDSITPHATSLMFMKIDPSLDDQDGNAANSDVIRTVPYTLLTGWGYERAFLPFSTMAPDGNIHLTYYSGGKKKEILHFMVVDTAGTVLSSRQVTQTATVSINNDETGYSLARIVFGRTKQLASDPLPVVLTNIGNGSGMMLAGTLFGFVFMGYIFTGGLNRRIKLLLLLMAPLVLSGMLVACSHDDDAAVYYDNIVYSDSRTGNAEIMVFTVPK